MRYLVCITVLLVAFAHDEEQARGDEEKLEKYAITF